MKPFQLHALSALTALCLAGGAFAQYVWLDEKGVKQYSDRPPPASVPTSRILKQPGGVPALSSETTTPAPKAEMSISEKNAEFRKRKAEQAEKEKKATEEAKVAAEKAKNCERAREFQRSLESGERISRTDKNGERSFLTDEQRDRELRDTRRILDECKS
jgi:hypothetical protein